MPSGNALSRKQRAVAFLRQAASGNARKAFDDYAGPSFRHHNPYFPANADALIAGMEENAAKNPRKVLEFQHALEDGDYVAVHSRIQMNPGEPGIAVVHLFRFDGDAIVELWDIGQPVPKDSPNENGMF